VLGRGEVVLAPRPSERDESQRVRGSPWKVPVMMVASISEPSQSSASRAISSSGVRAA